LTGEDTDSRVSYFDQYRYIAATFQLHTLLVLRKAKIAIPSRNKNHVIREIFPLYLDLLHDHDIGLESFEHGRKCPVLAPWLVSKGIANAVNIPGGDSKTHFERVDMGMVFVVTFGGNQMQSVLFNQANTSSGSKRLCSHQITVFDSPGAIHLKFYPVATRGESFTRQNPDASNDLDFSHHKHHRILQTATNLHSTTPVPRTNNTMLPQRALVRSAQRFSARTPARLPKRHSSTEHTFTGAEDNAFNRERAAVKQHAADSSGTRSPMLRTQLRLSSLKHRANRTQTFGESSLSSTYPETTEPPSPTSNSELPIATIEPQRN
jgi:hypothetical protein